MKKIKYQYLSCEVNTGTEEAPVMEQIFVEKVMPWNEENEAIAKREAYKGEYEIYDDGKPEPVPADDDEYADMAAAIREGVNGI